MRNEGRVKLKIRDSVLRKDIEDAILRQMSEAKAAHQERNEDLREMDDQVQGMLGVSSNSPWRDACTLDDPITLDQELTLSAMLSQAVMRDPKVIIGGVSKEDDRNAEVLESYLTTKHYEADYNKVLDGLIYNALRWPVAILFDGWREDIEDIRYTGYKDVETGEVVEEEFREEEKEYDEVPQLKPGFITYRGLDLRVVDTPDFYLYPATSISIKQATACGERMRLTRHALLDAVYSLQLDEDKVYELLSKGPVGTTVEEGGDEYREVMHERDGIETAEDEFYEIFVWYTRIPLLFSDKGTLRTPDWLLNDDILCIGCPEQRIMLRMDFTPYKTRPYLPYYMLEIPNSFYGWCLPRMLDAIQAEANANLQMGINVMNFELQPSLKAPDMFRKEFENVQLGPGKILFYPGKDPNVIQPLYFPQTTRGSESMQQWLGNKAEKLISAGGFGSYQPKQRKNVETQAVQQAAFTKFDHILSTFQRGIKDTYLHSAALLAEKMDDDGEDFLDESDSTQHVDPQMLKGRFILRPSATSTNTDPQTRIEMAEKIKEIADEWYAMLSKPEIPPQILKLAWETRRKVLLAMGEHNPEKILGDQPEGSVQPQQPPASPGMELTSMPLLNQLGVANGQAGIGNGAVPLGIPSGE